MSYFCSFHPLHHHHLGQVVVLVIAKAGAKARININLRGATTFRHPFRHQLFLPCRALIIRVTATTAIGQVTVIAARMENRNLIIRPTISLPEVQAI